MSKTKIIQNVFISPAILSAINDGKVQIVINQNNAVTQSDLPKADEATFWEYLMSLPEPRINNLILKAMVIACKMCPTKKDAAKFLGISEETIYKYVSEGHPFNFNCRGGGHTLPREKNKLRLIYAPEGEDGSKS